MKPNGLFSKEDALVQEAKAQLDANKTLDADASSDLLAGYAKLLKTAKRLMRLSDLNEKALREANASVSQKNQELEGLSSRLSKFLSPQLYERLFTDGTSVDLSSERKRLTVMFSDLVGFTDLSDRLEPEELTGILNSYLEAMAELVTEYGGTFDKFIGDGMMVFFGDPSSRGAREDAKACVQMALAMQQRLQHLRMKWRTDGFPDQISCRMGIHTGYCTVGNFGSPSRMDYTIIGSTVNLAARLESQSDPNSILVSHATQSLLSDDFSFEPVAPLTLKGFPRPVEAFRVLSEEANSAAAKARQLAQQLLDLEAMSPETRKASLEGIEDLVASLKSST